MNKFFFGLILFSVIQYNGNAQLSKSNALLLELNKNSSISYEITTLTEEIPVVDRTNNLNHNNYYRIETNRGFNLIKYEKTDKIKECLKRAEDYFRMGYFIYAREMYHRILKFEPTYYKVITYIGQTYGLENNHEKAVEWYKKAIEANYIDYLAHWLLADIYRQKGENKMALEEITIARILNRNNPRIKRTYDEIYATQELNTEDFVLNPQLKIDSIAPKKVNIAVHPNWQEYAVLKAKLFFEPFSLSNNEPRVDNFSLKNEQKCLYALLSNLDKDEIDKTPEFKALKIAKNKKMLTEYILYELWLPENPILAYKLSKEDIESIKNYVIKVRGKKL